MASGNKALKVLVDQEVIKSLVSVKTNALDDSLKEDALIAIDVAINSNVLRYVRSPGNRYSIVTYSYITFSPYSLQARSCDFSL